MFLLQIINWEHLKLSLSLKRQYKEAGTFINMDNIFRRILTKQSSNDEKTETKTSPQNNQVSKPMMPNNGVITSQSPRNFIKRQSSVDQDQHFYLMWVNTWCETGYMKAAKLTFLFLGDCIAKAMVIKKHSAFNAHLTYNFLILFLPSVNFVRSNSLSRIYAYRFLLFKL